MVTGYYRGHEIECKDGVCWRYCDTGEIVPGNGRVNQFCIRCKCPPTDEDHDACLGTLDESIVKNACCGHGEDQWAYIQFRDGTDVRGEAAIAKIRELKGCNEKE